MASKVLEMDSPFIRIAAAVAPVIDWRFYGIPSYCMFRKSD